MGASQSTPRTDEKVFVSETPIQFSQDVVNHLSDHMASPDTPPERQSSIDAHIRSHIQSELARLREEEEQVKDEIERALEKENLDREREMAGEESQSEGEEASAGSVKSSAALMGDLEEVRRKVERFHTRQELEGYSAVQAKGEAVVSCYRSHPSTTLDCWREVSEFKSSVAQVEKVRCTNLNTAVLEDSYSVIAIRELPPIVPKYKLPLDWHHLMNQPYYTTKQK
ncbi:hypothetical protein AcW1_005474 [Taiwanofungus camphoratus]|nr:hypothetical protein AcW1_005474 [Antrodia cinnamomea]